VNPEDGHPSGRVKLIEPLRHRDFRFLWVGQTVSLLGDGLFTVALIWQTLQLSSSPVALGIVAFARSVPRLALLLLGGAVSDRLPRRRILLLVDATQALAVAGIAVLGASGHLELWHLIVLAVIVGAAEAFFFPSFTGIVPELVPAASFVQANALTSASRLLTSEFLGPALGGLLIAAVGTSLAFALDALSFVVSAAALAAMRKVVLAERTDSKMLQEIREGFRFTRSQPWLWVTLWSSGVGNFFISGCLGVLIPLVIKHHLHAGAPGLGVYFAALGLGGGIGVLVSARFGSPRRRMTVMYCVWGAGGVAILACGLAPGLTILLIFSAVVGFLNEYGNILWTALMQDLVPRPMLGRVSSLDWFISLGLQPLSFAAAAPIALVVGIIPAIIGAGVLDVLASAVGLYQPGVRDPERSEVGE
jgi:MFS family permease